MQFTTEIFTPMLDNQQFLLEADLVIDLMKKHKVEAIEICFGYAWGEYDVSRIELKDLMKVISDRRTYRSAIRK